MPRKAREQNLSKANSAQQTWGLRVVPQALRNASELSLFPVAPIAKTFVPLGLKGTLCLVQVILFALMQLNRDGMCSARQVGGKGSL